MIRSEQLGPGTVDLFGERLAAWMISPVVEILDEVEDEAANPGVLAPDGVGYQDMRKQGLIARPVGGIAGVGRVARGQEDMRAVAELFAGRLWHPGNENSLHQSVHLYRVRAVVDAGQRELLDIADRPAKADRIRRVSSNWSVIVALELVSR
jgi:hypothetical protein